MQQHPIPQNVTQYQFRLVGDMTLKQFLELALGLLLGYMFYSSNLIFIFKWPLVILSIMLGAGLAFFPIEDRPLDQWLINFVKAIYAPTRFTWQKTNKVPSLFLFTPHAAEVVNTITKTIKAPVNLVSPAPATDLSDFEAEKLSSLDSLFKSLPTPPQGSAIPTAQLHEPSIVKPTISVRKLTPITVLTGKEIQTPKTVPVAIPKSPTVQPPIVNNAPLENVIFSAPSAMATPKVAPSTATPKKIILPASPKQPNLVTGVLVDQNNLLVEGAIVQIVSGDGIPARAMKTNSLGQFYTSTPLHDGTYIIEVEKAGVNFTPQQITINGSVLSPFELHATT